MFAHFSTYSEISDLNPIKGKFVRLESVVGRLMNPFVNLSHVREIGENPCVQFNDLIGGVNGVKYAIQRITAQ